MLLSFLLTILPMNSYADFGDSIARAFFQKKVEQLYEKAKLCSPLEKDSKSSMDVNDWIKIQPPLPSWQMLPDLEKTAMDARTYARSIGGNDKKLHCLAGCYIAQKLDYKSAVMVGWYKELTDASDCSKKTSFEKKDYEATVVGARLGSSDSRCESLCKK